MEQWERDFLRDMAKEKLELSQTDWMKSRVKGWTALNDGTSRQPMIHFEMGTVGTPGFQYSCRCTSPDARGLEWQMGSEMHIMSDIFRSHIITITCNDKITINIFFENIL